MSMHLLMPATYVCLVPHVNYLLARALVVAANQDAQGSSGQGVFQLVEFLWNSNIGIFVTFATLLERVISYSKVVMKNINRRLNVAGEKRGHYQISTPCNVHYPEVKFNQICVTLKYVDLTVPLVWLLFHILPVWLYLSPSNNTWQIHAYKNHNRIDKLPGCLPEKGKPGESKILHMSVVQPSRRYENRRNQEVSNHSLSYYSALGYGVHCRKKSTGLRTVMMNAIKGARIRVQVKNLNKQK